MEGEGLSGQPRDMPLLLVFVRGGLTAFHLGLQDELPRLLNQQIGYGQVIAAETRRGLEFIPVLVGPLKRDFVERDV